MIQGTHQQAEAQQAQGRWPGFLHQDGKQGSNGPDLPEGIQELTAPNLRLPARGLCRWDAAPGCPT